ncbi:MAG TPA: STAS domain-containing protein [Burkholderiales bacterium]|jgi:ABC-type transporter Mla MlaB component|nr:STAS domain-containing protein [Burkholderiales bacterium]
MAKTGKAAAKARALKLEGDLRIGGAAAVLELLRAAARKPEKLVALDASQVEKVDAAGLQALLVGRQLLAQAGKSVSWTTPSTQLTAAAALLGLAERLELPR